MPGAAEVRTLLGCGAFMMRNPDQPEALAWWRWGHGRVSRRAELEHRDVSSRSFDWLAIVINDS